MTEVVVGAVLALAGLYLALGVLAAVPLHVRGLAAVDPRVVGAGWLFRALVTPGVVVLWPLLVARWQRARTGGRTHGEADGPVASVGLRRRHRLASTAVTAVVPALAALALLARPPLPIAAPAAREVLAEPAPDGEVVAAWDMPFARLPIVVRLRLGGQGGRQLELEVARDLELPGVVAFWIAPGGGRVLLGSVWGPGVHRYQLPTGNGAVELYSLAHRQRLGTLPVGGS